MSLRPFESSAAFVFCALLVTSPPAIAQQPGTPESFSRAPAVSSGCSGPGPGIINGRVPNYTQDTSGFVRIVAGDEEGDAFVSALTEAESAKAWLMKTFSDNKKAAEFQKNPYSVLAISGYHGSMTDSAALMTYMQQESLKYKRSIQAAQSSKQVFLTKDGSFTCGGVATGKYHVVVMLNHIPQSAVSGGNNATGMSQTTLESDVVVPRVPPGSKVLVPVTQYRQLMLLKK